ncbi:unnamed protein product [Caenorhabditis angaria]|uniref:Eukaryotic translation initiation factor 5A n=1 Tax=Caenorhabditis angaria TaxID=860376 RepID=A0A9P1I8M5_9PELO|nr:unnamed protein product [Caenorhabditis angaria]
MNTFPKQCSALHKNDYIVIKGRPSKIIDISTLNSGELHIFALDIFTNQNLEETFPPTQNIDVPVVERREYQLLEIENGYASVFCDEGDEPKADIKIPENEIGQQIRDAFEKDEGPVIVQVISACGEEAIIRLKTD